MKTIIIGLLLTLIGSGWAIGAESWERRTDPSTLLKQGAVRLSSGQVKRLIIGNTEPWGPNNSGRDAGYYSPDGKVYGKLSGKREIGRYSIKSDGSVCIRFKDLPGGGCQYYLRYKNKVVVVWSGSTRGVKAYRTGNRLL